MSLETVSTKRNRVYARKFDHDLARQLRRDGLSYAVIAEQMGVTVAAVARVCDERIRKRMYAQSKAYIERHRPLCLGGCGRLVWTQKGRSGYCIACLKRLKDADRDDVRPAELRCYRCGAWKPDSDFPPARGSAKQPARRGHHGRCRACENEIRNDHRRRKPQIERETSRRAYIKKRRKVMTGYVVLRPKGGGYEEVGRVEAVSSTHAIESVVTEAGSYCAVKESTLKLFQVGQVQSFRVLPAEPESSVQAVA